MQRISKRTFDVILVILLLPVLVPVIAIVWLIVRSDGGVGFFGHTRVGRGGRAFKCWKLRTMVPNAEAALTGYLRDNPDAAAEWQRDFKLTNDPRITRIGNFLRKTSLDELPQLWNVIKGEMSFVGPRPVIHSELAKYKDCIWAYQIMKPGVTGLWQVSGRNDVSYDERVAMDVDYAKRSSLWLDAWLVLMTAKAVVKGTGK